MWSVLSDKHGAKECKISEITKYSAPQKVTKLKKQQCA